VGAGGCLPGCSIAVARTVDVDGGSIVDLRI
jgi:hypothetical protein